MKYRYSEPPRRGLIYHYKNFMLGDGQLVSVFQEFRYLLPFYKIYGLDIRNPRVERYNVTIYFIFIADVLHDLEFLIFA